MWLVVTSDNGGFTGARMFKANSEEGGAIALPNHQMSDQCSVRSYVGIMYLIWW